MKMLQPLLIGVLIHVELNSMTLDTASRKLRLLPSLCGFIEIHFLSKYICQLAYYCAEGRVWISDSHMDQMLSYSSVVRGLHRHGYVSSSFREIKVLMSARKKNPFTTFTRSHT